MVYDCIEAETQHAINGRPLYLCIRAAPQQMKVNLEGRGLG